MTMATNLELNPPLNGNTGWGEPNDPLNHRLMKERLFADFNESWNIYKDIKALVEAKGEETPMEKLVRESMPYDGGWDCDYVDKLLYGSAAFVNQGSVGSCVGAGGASAVATKIAQEILIEGDPENPFGLKVMQYDSDAINCAVPNVDYSYGCGKMSNYWDKDDQKFTTSRRLGDGSYCSAQIWAFTTCGILPCSEVKVEGLVFPQTNNIRHYAGNGSNFLNNHVEVGLKYRMDNTVRVHSGDELKRVLTELKQPCMICSGAAFVPSHHVDGLGWVYRRRGVWMHNMTLCACVLYKGTWYVKVRNQWGPNAHKDGWSFWIELEHFDKNWIGDAECSSIGELNLKPSQAIPDFPFWGGSDVR